MDNSFLKLYLNDFDAAEMNENIPAYRTRYSGFIQMFPNEWFLQYSNCDRNIAFGGNIKIELIDVCQNVVFTFTKNVNFLYKEFIDSNGISQIKYKFGNIGIDFGKDILFLKLTHTTSTKIWYSAGFCVTENLGEETSFIRYRNESQFKGIAYDIANDFQGIRICGFIDDFDINEDKEEQIQITGRGSSSRVVSTTFDRYIMYQCDRFTWARLQILLDHDIIYINNYRISNKPKINKEQRQQDANVFQLTFDAYPTEEKYLSEFEAIELVPFGSYDISALPLDITAKFNKDIVIDSGFLKIYDASNDTLVSTLTELDFNIVGTDKISTLGYSLVALGIGKYYILVSLGFIESWDGDDFNITDKRVWPFEITTNNRYHKPSYSAQYS